MALSRLENFKLYKMMFLMRQAEEAIRVHYKENEMKTPMHMSMGEEAIVAGVVDALNQDDQVLGTYRSHALYLAKSGDVDGFFAELYGRETGNAKGKAGSMHLSSSKDGLMGTSAIVGTTIPVAVGCAFAAMYKGENKRIVSFFGDGAIDEGSFWESFNFACLKRLPIIFVCEDNDLAIHTDKKVRRGYKTIVNIIRQFNCYTFESDTTDCESIFETTKLFISEQEKMMKPVFFNFKYYRYLEHVGINEDFDAGYRNKDEYLEWLLKDPVKLQRKKLIALGITEQEIKRSEFEIYNSITEAMNKAKSAFFARKSELKSNVYA